MSWLVSGTPLKLTAGGTFAPADKPYAVEFFAYETVGLSFGSLPGLARAAFGREVRRPRFTRVRREASHG